MLTLGLLALSCYLIYRFLKPKIPKNFPPGPNNLPFVGGTLYLSTLGETGSEAFGKLGEIYGPVSGVYLGKDRAVIINGYEATKEFYARDEFPFRPNLFTLTYQWGGRMLGVFFSNGRLWQEQKRFTLRHLREFGFGKTSMEALIHEEAEQCIQSIKKAMKQSTNSTVLVSDKFGVPMINILWAIIGGNRYSYEDEQFRKLLDVVQSTFRTGSVRGNLVNSYPFLRHFPYFKNEFKALVSGFFVIREIVEEAVREHAKSRDPTSPRDLIDVYLEAMENSKDDANSTFFMDQLVQICEDLFAAGSESTSNSVAYAILHMVRNPEIQEKVQKELDDVIGRERFPSFADKEKLPYTYATVSENFRLTPVAPVSVPHFNFEDVKFMGYNIPKESWALVNYSSTNLDKKYWGDDAHIFRPERFLDHNGKFDKSKLDHVFGFGAGKRICLGETLARATNFILFTAVIKRLKFELAPGQPLPSIVPIDGFTVAPQPFSAKVSIRY